MARAWLFPGQGSQHRGMGTELFDAYPDLVSAADDILGYSVRQACESGARLSDTAHVQPLMFVVNALHLSRALDASAAPDFLAGHSLGEISALHAAGCMDFATGLDLVRRRGALMAACPPGAMLAVLGVPVKRIEELIADHGLAAIDIANHNLPDQVVTAGPEAEIRRLADEIDDRQLGRTARLNVSVAAHSRYMRSAVPEFAAVLDGIDFAPPRIPVFSAVTAERHAAADIARRLGEQLTGQVRWWDVMTALSRAGVDQVLEIGPGNVLGRMWERAAGRLPGRTSPVPATVPVAPQDRPVASQDRPVAPQDRPVAPQDRPVASQDRPVAPRPAGTPRAYRLRLPYLVDALPCGVSGPAMLRRLAGAGLLGFLGTRRRSAAQVAADVRDLSPEDVRGRWGIELPAERLDPGRAREIVSLALEAGVARAVTDGWAGVSPQLVRWRFTRGSTGAGPRRLLVRVAGSDQAAAFLCPAPAGLVAQLVRSGELDEAEADEARRRPVATEICVQPEPDGGSTASLLMSVLRATREASGNGEGRREPVSVGVGGIGTPEEVASALLLGADFLVTGAINACTPQARTCDAVKDLLATVTMADTVLAPSADLFRQGGREHMVRKATLFPVRAAHLYGLHLARVSPAELSPATRQVLESDYFGEPLDQVTASEPRPANLLGRYFDLGTEAALAGRADQQLNWYIPGGPEMGAFNNAAGRVGLADWRARDVDVVAERLTAAGAQLLDRRLRDVIRRTGELADAAAQS
jgi:trans-AT polyketide synthase/acyltransferase/oxidoreductase domain-containing protein